MPIFASPHCITEQKTYRLFTSHEENTCFTEELGLAELGKLRWFGMRLHSPSALVKQL